jgi:hypothetical protein
MALPDHIVETKDGKQAWRCENCFFYDLADWTEAEPENEFGNCRRYPPKLARHDMGPQAQREFPMTNRYDWCGEFVAISDRPAWATKPAAESD